MEPPPIRSWPGMPPPWMQWFRTLTKDSSDESLYQAPLPAADALELEKRFEALAQMPTPPEFVQMLEEVNTQVQVLMATVAAQQQEIESLKQGVQL